MHIRNSYSFQAVVYEIQIEIKMLFLVTKSITFLAMYRISGYSPGCFRIQPFSTPGCISGSGEKSFKQSDIKTGCSTYFIRVATVAISDRQVSDIFINRVQTLSRTNN